MSAAAVTDTRVHQCSNKLHVQGKPTVHCALDTLRTLKIQHHKVRLSEEFNEDIDWWLRYLDCLSYTNIIASPLNKTFHVCADAFTAGLDTTHDWLYVNSDRDLPTIKDAHIEIIAEMDAFYRWGPLKASSSVIAQTDNKQSSH